MMEQPSLLIRPHPRRMEGPRGYLQRLAIDNFVLLTDLVTLNIDFRLGTLIYAGLMPDSAIDPSLHDYVQKVAELWEYKPRVWNRQYARFCPHCLSDDPYWRVGWELYFYDACPEHKVWLMDHCSSCGQPLKWNRESLIRCTCGADLRLEHSALCPENVSWLAQVLQDKLIGKAGHVVSPPLQLLNVAQTQQLIAYIGMHLRPGVGSRPLKIRQTGSMAVSWPISSHAAEVFAQWPQSFHRMLDYFQSQETGRSLKKNFGHTYQYLYVGLVGGAFDSVRAAFEEWLVTSWRGGLARRNRRLLDTILHRAEWVPTKIVSEMLGISLKRVESLIRAGVLEGETIVYESGRRFTTVRKDGLERVTGYLKNGIDLRSATEMLGLTKKRIRGVLRMLFPNATKSADSLSSPWYVPLTDIDAVLVIRENLPKVAIPDEGCVSLSHILRYFSWSEVEIVALIGAIQKGEIQPVAVLDGAKGISGVVFQENQIKPWREKQNHGLGSWLSVPQAAQILGIHQQAAYDLAHFGFIETIKVSRVLGGGSRVSRLELERFNKEFVLCSEMARVLGTSSRKVRWQLAKANVYPISGPGVDAGRQIVYSRNTVSEFLSGDSFVNHVGKSDETGKTGPPIPNINQKPSDLY